MSTRILVSWSSAGSRAGRLRQGSPRPARSPLRCKHSARRPRRPPPRAAAAPSTGQSSCVPSSTPGRERVARAGRAADLPRAAPGPSPAARSGRQAPRRRSRPGSAPRPAGRPPASSSAPAIASSAGQSTGPVRSAAHGGIDRSARGLQLVDHDAVQVRQAGQGHLPEPLRRQATSSMLVCRPAAWPRRATPTSRSPAARRCQRPSAGCSPGAPDVQDPRARERRRPTRRRTARSPRWWWKNVRRPPSRSIIASVNEVARRAAAARPVCRCPAARTRRGRSPRAGPRRPHRSCRAGSRPRAGAGRPPCSAPGRRCRGSPARWSASRSGAG